MNPRHPLVWLVSQVVLATAVVLVSELIIWLLPGSPSSTEQAAVFLAVLALVFLGYYRFLRARP
jgi:hypothetical protein